jgi:hypothetical protein
MQNNATVDQRLKGLSVHRSPQAPESSLSSGGHLDIHGSETNYLGATHWIAILENVGIPRVSRALDDGLLTCCIQSILELGRDDNEEISTPALPIGPDIVIDIGLSLTLTEVCNSLKLRATVDRLLSVYFNAKHVQICKNTP